MDARLLGESHDSEEEVDIPSEHDANRTVLNKSMLEDGLDDLTLNESVFLEAGAVSNAEDSVVLRESSKGLDDVKKSAIQKQSEKYLMKKSLNPGRRGQESIMSMSNVKCSREPSGARRPEPKASIVNSGSVVKALAVQRAEAAGQEVTGPYGPILHNDLSPLQQAQVEVFGQKIKQQNKEQLKARKRKSSKNRNGLSRYKFEDLVSQTEKKVQHHQQSSLASEWPARPAKKISVVSNMLEPKKIYSENQRKYYGASNVLGEQDEASLKPFKSAIKVGKGPDGKAGLVNDWKKGRSRMQVVQSTQAKAIIISSDEGGEIDSPTMSDHEGPLSQNQLRNAPLYEPAVQNAHLLRRLPPEPGHEESKQRPKQAAASQYRSEVTPTRVAPKKQHPFHQAQYFTASNKRKEARVQENVSNSSQDKLSGKK